MPLSSSNPEAGIPTLYRDAFAMLRASGTLRRSLGGWCGVGLVVAAGFSTALGGLHGSGVAAATIAGFGWWLLVSVAFTGGIPLLITPDRCRIDHFGVPNGLTAVRAWICLPLVLDSVLTLPDHLGFILWCTVGGGAAFLDLIDGVVARRLGPITDLGKALDPAMDALFFAMAAVSGYALGVVPGWLMALLLLRYIGPLLATPLVLLARRRPELVHTTWGRRNTAAVGLTLFVLMWVRIFNGPVGTAAIILGGVLLVPTTVLHFAGLANRVYRSPTLP